MLFCAAAAIVLIGVLASGVMRFLFRTKTAPILIVLGATLAGSFFAAWTAYDGYHKTAASNLASNVSYKYPKLVLADPNTVIDQYLKLSPAGGNAPLEATFLNGQDKLVYRMDASNGSAEPLLGPADKSTAPNPIEFARPGESH